MGGPTMAMIAKKSADVRVVVVDLDASRVAAWNSDQLPIYEPGLDEIVKSARGRNLFFSTDVDCWHPRLRDRLRQRQHTDEELWHGRRNA